MGLVVSRSGLQRVLGGTSVNVLLGIQGDPSGPINSRNGQEFGKGMCFGEINSEELGLSPVSHPGNRMALGKPRPRNLEGAGLDLGVCITTS